MLYLFYGVSGANSLLVFANFCQLQHCWSNRYFASNASWCEVARRADAACVARPQICSFHRLGAPCTILGCALYHTWVRPCTINADTYFSFLRYPACYGTILSFSAWHTLRYPVIRTPPAAELRNGSKKGRMPGRPLSLTVFSPLWGWGRAKQGDQGTGCWSHWSRV